MKALYTFTQVVAKILEVFQWVALGFMVALFIGSFFPSSLAGFVVQGSPSDVDLTTYGYTITVFSDGGELNYLAVRMFALGAIFLFGLMAMVFRNVYLLIKTMRGETWFSKGETPFQNDVTRMIREIGIFLILIAVIGLIFSAVARVVLETSGIPDAVHSSLNIETVVIGLLMLCLSNVFAQGEDMQGEVDGLV